MPKKTVEVNLVEDDVETSLDNVLGEIEARNEDGVLLVDYKIMLKKAIAKLTFEAP